MRTVLCALLLAACAAKSAPSGISPRKMADAVYAVIAADRQVYTREVVNRLSKANVIKAEEHFRDENALPLPAQMLRMGAETVFKGDHGFTYALLSPWPINKQNAPRTAVEKEGLAKVADKGEPFYGEEKLGGTRYFTAIYPDKAVSEACVSCHNANADSPRNDFKEGDVMGGVVVRIALD